MAWEYIIANWHLMKFEVQKRWDELTDEDLFVIQGNQNELIAKLQERYSISKERAQQEIEVFLKEQINLQSQGINNANE